MTTLNTHMFLSNVFFLSQMAKKPLSVKTNLFSAENYRMKCSLRNIIGIRGYRHIFSACLYFHFDDLWPAKSKKQMLTQSARLAKPGYLLVPQGLWTAWSICGSIKIFWLPSFHCKVSQNAHIRTKCKTPEG